MHGRDETAGLESAAAPAWATKQTAAAPKQMFGGATRTTPRAWMAAQKKPQDEEALRIAKEVPRGRADRRARRVIDDDDDEEEGDIAAPSARPPRKEQVQDEYTQNKLRIQSSGQKRRGRSAWVIDDDDDDEADDAAAATPSGPPPRGQQAQDEDAQNGLEIDQEPRIRRRRKARVVVDDDDDDDIAASSLALQCPVSGPQLPSPTTPSLEHGGTTAGATQRIERPDTPNTIERQLEKQFQEALNGLNESLGYGKASLLPSPALTNGLMVEKGVSLSPEPDLVPWGGDEDGSYLHRIEGWSYDEPPLEEELPQDEERVPEENPALEGASPPMDGPAPMDDPAPLGDFAPEEEPGEFRPPKRLHIDEGAAYAPRSLSPQSIVSEEDDQNDERGDGTPLEEETSEAGPPKRARLSDGPAEFPPHPWPLPDQERDDDWAVRMPPAEEQVEGRSPKRLRFDTNATEALPSGDLDDDMAPSPATRRPLVPRAVQIQTASAHRHDSAISPSGPSSTNCVPSTVSLADGGQLHNSPSNPPSGDLGSNMHPGFETRREREDASLLEYALQGSGKYVFYNAEQYMNGLERVSATYPELQEKWVIVMLLLRTAARAGDYLFLFTIQSYCRLSLILTKNGVSKGFLESFGSIDDVHRSLQVLGDMLETHTISVAAEQALAALPMPLESMSAIHPGSFRALVSLTATLVNRLARYDAPLESEWRRRGYGPLPRELVFGLGCASPTLARHAFQHSLWGTWGIPRGVVPAGGWAECMLEAINAGEAMWNTFTSNGGRETTETQGAEAVLIRRSLQIKEKFEALPRGVYICRFSHEHCLPCLPRGGTCIY
jgi:hypothetical protein